MTADDLRNTYGTADTGTQTDRGFRVDNVFHSKDNGDIHYSLYIPESYDGSEPYALFISLPGWEGLYFQGAGANLQELFPFEAEKYIRNMIIVSPQLEDWGETSADQTIALTEYMLQAYNIDQDRFILRGIPAEVRQAPLWSENVRISILPG